MAGVAGGSATLLVTQSATCYDLELGIPPTAALAPGEYVVEVHNGLQTNWSALERPLRYDVPTPRNILKKH